MINSCLKTDTLWSIWLFSYTIFLKNSSFCYHSQMVIYTPMKGHKIQYHCRPTVQQRKSSPGLVSEWDRWAGGPLRWPLLLSSDNSSLSKSQHISLRNTSKSMSWESQERDSCSGISSKYLRYCQIKSIWLYCPNSQSHCLNGLYSLYCDDYDCNHLSLIFPSIQLL